MPHSGASPAEVVSLVVRAGGIAALAHPGHLDRDDAFPGMVDAGLGAMEAFHPSHDGAATDHYLALARRYGLSVTGGSDYHGEGIRRAEFFGVIGLPLAHFVAFLTRAKQALQPPLQRPTDEPRPSSAV